jgi:hypothetical protein
MNEKNKWIKIKYLYYINVNIYTRNKRE